jgi:hypothetical protein
VWSLREIEQVERRSRKRKTKAAEKTLMVFSAASAKLLRLLR